MLQAEAFLVKLLFKLSWFIIKVAHKQPELRKT